MSKGYKGGEFEREVSVALSKWWTKGERDDIFWRSSQSGGRATERAKHGKTTYGSYGDIAALDPIGTPLLRFFTIELKRGSSHGCPGDLLDAAETRAVRPIEAALEQTIRSHELAKSHGWLLICRRDRKRAVVYMDWSSFQLLHSFGSLKAAPFLSFRLSINRPGGTRSVVFIGMLFEAFLQRVTPEQIMKCYEQTKVESPR